MNIKETSLNTESIYRDYLKKLEFVVNYERSTLTSSVKFFEISYYGALERHINGKYNKLDRLIEEAKPMTGMDIMKGVSEVIDLHNKINKDKTIKLIKEYLISTPTGRKKLNPKEYLTLAKAMEIYHYLDNRRSNKFNSRSMYKILVNLHHHSIELSLQNNTKLHFVHKDVLKKELEAVAGDHGIEFTTVFSLEHELKKKEK